MTLIADFGVWICLWLATYGIRHVIQKRGFTYTERYMVTVLLFLSSTIITVFVFQNLIRRLIEEFSVNPLIILTIVYLSVILTYHFSHKYLKKPAKLIRDHPAQYFINMDYRYLFSKSFDLLFQQTLIVVLVLLLDDAELSFFGIVLYFASLFGLLHLIYLISIPDKFFGTYYLIAYLLSAVIFPVLILKIHYGFVYTYIIHLLFYTLSGIFFWLLVGKKTSKS